MISVTSTPTQDQLDVWWAAMEADDLSVAFSDRFPKTLADFRREVQQRQKVLFFCLADGESAGAMWLYTLHSGSPPCWVGVYIMPQYRGYTFARDFAQEAIRQARELSIPHVFAAVNVGNIPSKKFTEAMGFIYVDRVAGFSSFQGVLTDSYIYTLHLHDITMAKQISTTYAFRNKVVSDLHRL